MNAVQQTTKSSCLCVGLGNPGTEYTKTRHNAGYLFLESVAKRAEVHFVKKSRWFAEYAEVQAHTKLAESRTNQLVMLAKPNTFMNKSGQAVQAISAFYKIQPQFLFVAFDDLDLPLGTSKVQFGVGPKTHNGLQSIYEQIGTDQFWHIRIGIDTRNGDRSMPPSNYVLQAMSDDELTSLHAAFLPIIVHLEQRSLW